MIKACAIWDRKTGQFAISIAWEKKLIVLEAGFLHIWFNPVPTDQVNGWTAKTIYLIPWEGSPPEQQGRDMTMTLRPPIHLYFILSKSYCYVWRETAQNLPPGNTPIQPFIFFWFVCGQNRSIDSVLLILIEPHGRVLYPVVCGILPQISLCGIYI